MMYSACKINKQGDNIQPWHIPFPIWNQPVVPMSSSNCCFLTCVQISQDADQVVWYSHFLKNFPQFIVIHTVKGVGIVNKAREFQKNIYFCFIADTLWLHRLWPARLLGPWNFLGKNTGVGCHFPLQGIFPTQGLRWCLLHLLHWQVGSLLLVSPAKPILSKQ